MTETKPVVGAEPATAAAAPANVYDHSTPAAAAETKATDGDVEAQKPAPAAPPQHLLRLRDTTMTLARELELPCSSLS